MNYQTAALLLITVFAATNSLSNTPDETAGLIPCDNNSGHCTTRFECNRKHGTISGRCFIPLLVCCKTTTAELKCGDSTSNKLTYFKSNSQTAGTCSLRIKPTNTQICQLRIDFESFTLAQPTLPQTDATSAYTCADDYFTVAVNENINFRLPTLCGENSKQHIYIPANVNSVNDVIATLNFHTSSKSSPSWKLKIVQLECPQTNDQTNSGDFRISPSKYHSNGLNKKYDKIAPAGCLQYYTSEEGTFRSFNFNNGRGPYTGNLQYSICFERSLKACGIRYTSTAFQLGFNNNAAGYTERDCDQKAGQNPLVTDYLLIPDGKTSGGTSASKFCYNSTLNSAITSNALAPWYVQFVSGNQRAATPTIQQGFEIKYQILYSGCN